MKKIYGTYRRIHIIGQAGLFGPADFLNKQYEDYNKAGVTFINDTPIDNIKYSKEVAPGIIKLKRLIIGEYNENHISELEFKDNIKNVGTQFQIEMFDDIEVCKQWIRDNTNLIEEENGKFNNGTYYEDIKGERDIEIKKIEYLTNEETMEVTEKEVIEIVKEEYIIETIEKIKYLIIN